MNTRNLVMTRVVAWAIATSVVGAVAVGYESLPAMIPVTRWTEAPKSLLIALRVPLINLMSVGMIESLSPSLRRIKDFHRADGVVAVLLLTAAAKAAIEGAGILMLPRSFAWTLIPLVTVLLAGIASASYIGRQLMDPRRWSELKMTATESVAAIACLIGIAILNLPLLAG